MLAEVSVDLMNNFCICFVLVQVGGKGGRAGPYSKSDRDIYKGY